MSQHLDLEPPTGRWSHVHRHIDEAWRRSAGRPAELDAHDLLSRARQQALLEDFGSGSFREGFDRLIDALNETAELHTFGRWAWRDRIVGLLINRLAVRDWTKKHPLVHHERVEAPLIITGLDLTGVKFLASVLQLDPNVRTPRAWETAAVCPPQSIGMPVPPAGRDFVGVDRPGSCDRLLGTEFVGSFDLDAEIPSYGDWFRSCDMTAAYDLHHHQLKVLQSALPTTQWVLHGLAHAWHLAALLEQYPDAQIVWVHRDPVAMLSEAVTYRRAVDAVSSDRVVDGPAADVGFVEQWSQRFASGIATLEAAHPSPSIYNVQAIELADDPVGIVEMMYRRAGRELGDLGRHRMQAALLAGVLPAPPERSELAPEQVDALRTQFADYTSQFEVPSERPSP